MALADHVKEMHDSGVCAPPHKDLQPSLCRRWVVCAWFLKPSTSCYFPSIEHNSPAVWLSDVPSPVTPWYGRQSLSEEPNLIRNVESFPTQSWPLSLQIWFIKLLSDTRHKQPATDFVGFMKRFVFCTEFTLVNWQLHYNRMSHKELAFIRYSPFKSAHNAKVLSVRWTAITEESLLRLKVPRLRRLVLLIKSSIKTKLSMDHWWNDANRV